MKRATQFVHAALALYLVNLAVMVGITLWTSRHGLELLTVATLGRTVLSAGAIVLLMLAVRHLRMSAEIYQDHCRYLREVVLVLSTKAKDPHTELTIAGIDRRAEIER